MGRVTKPDFRAIFGALPGMQVLLDCTFHIVEASDAYLQVGGVSREDILGRYIFDVFPENPQAPETRSVANLTASFERVLKTKQPDVMPDQRYDTQVGDGAAGSVFEERYWRPVNRPILNAAGEVQWILHEVEEITEQVRETLGDVDRNPAAAERRRMVGQLRGGNALLLSLPDPLFALLAPHLAPVRVAADTVLIEPLAPVRTAYFPLFGMVSVSRPLEDGSSVEVALGGQGGLIGSSVLTGEFTEPTEARALVEGVVLGIRTNTLQKIMTAHPDLRAALSRFIPAVLDQMSLSAACVARHSLDQRLARWLLTAADRVGSPDLPLRQEPLAHMLGVRRTGVSEALSRLESVGIVMNHRGRIVIRDRARLEARSCGCFREAQERRNLMVNYLGARPLTAAAEISALADRYFALGPA